jgi:hypothetical protein
MNPADDMAAKIGPSERHLAGAGAGSDEKSNQQLRAILENLQRANPQRKPVEEDDVPSGTSPHFDHEVSEREAIYSRLVAIENEMKRRGSRGFVRYLVAICIGVAATLAWQSYGEAAKQIFATRAPELGWSPEAKQMIASWVEQLGWTKPPAGSENTAVQPSALEAGASKPPTAPSIDPERIQQMARDLATLRQTVEQLAAGQAQVTREIVKLEAADVEILEKIPAPPPPRPIAVPTRKPIPGPPSSRAPAASPTSLAPIPPPRP